MTHEMETPSIVVEPPRDDIDDLIDSAHLNSGFADYQNLFNTFPDTTSSSTNASAEQGLFSTPLDQSPLSSGQVSPLITTGLRDASSGNMFLSASGQNSPIDAWSPASTSSGDLFPDAWSDTSSTWESSSPSSPSLSPINTSMLNINLNDVQVIQGPSIRMRSNSYSGGSDSSVDSNIPRPRSASFANNPSGYAVHNQSLEQVYAWEASLHDPTSFTTPNGQFAGASPRLDTNLSLSGNSSPTYGSPSSPSYGSPSSPSYGSPSSPVFDPSLFNLPEIPSSPIYQLPVPLANQQSAMAHSRSQSTHLTVPSNMMSTLQRRGAHRRSHSHTGVHEHSSPTSPISPQLGRGQFPSHRGRQVVPSMSHHSRPLSLNREACYTPVDHTAAFLNINPATRMSQEGFSYSPSSSTSHSPLHSPIHSPLEIAVPDISDFVPTINVDDYDSNGLARRHSYGGVTHSPEPGQSNPSEHLHRAASDPIGRGRRPRARHVPRRFPGLLRPQKEVDESEPYRDPSLLMDVPIEGISSTSSSPSPSSDNDQKDTVASHKIVDASFKRRKKQGERGRFVCNICGHDFTAKHNLNNHLNSHSGVKPHKCDTCGQTFTTSGTAKRHQSNCGGRPPRKRP